MPNATTYLGQLLAGAAAIFDSVKIDRATREYEGQLHEGWELTFQKRLPEAAGCRFILAEALQGEHAEEYCAKILGFLAIWARYGIDTTERP